MNLTGREIANDPGGSNTDDLGQTIDLSTGSGLNSVRSMETGVTMQNGAEVKELFPSYLRPVNKWVVDEKGSPSRMKIDRRASFDPVKFMNRSDLEIEEQHEGSIMLEEIDPSDIFLQSMLSGETLIRGEEHLKRLKKTSYIRLDAKIFQTLWENQHLIPEHWKGTPEDPKHIFFDGTVLKNQFGRYVLTLYWDKDEKWRWTYCRLDIGGWNAHDLSAVLNLKDTIFLRRSVSKPFHYNQNIDVALNK